MRHMQNKPKNSGQYVFIFLLTLTAMTVSTSYAHEEIDIGVSKITFDQKCHAVITIENIGRRLPGSFYWINNSFTLEVSKGSTAETSASILKLDKKRALTATGGRFTWATTTEFVDEHNPLAAKLILDGHYIDSGQRNDVLMRPINCKRGIGEVPGDPIKPEHADMAISNVSVAADSCIATITLSNLTQVPLPADAWHVEQGVELVVFNTENDERYLSEHISRFDPEKKLAAGVTPFSFTSEKAIKSIKRAKFSLWKVPNDPEFSNNHFEIDIPSQCQ